jgi:hypothetical protein
MRNLQQKPLLNNSPARPDYVAEGKLLRGRDRLQAQKAYQWERAVLAEHLGYRCPLLRRNFRGDEIFPGGFTADRAGELQVRAAALEFLARVWTTYAPNYRPRRIEVPRLRIGFRVCLRGLPSSRPLSAHARILSHAIYVPLDMLRRSTILHEIAHLLTPATEHGPVFCAALADLWNAEFGIEKPRALQLADEHGVQVA